MMKSALDMFLRRFLTIGRLAVRWPEGGEPFADAIEHRPRIRLTIRQHRRVLEQWPRSNLPQERRASARA
jgi:hypothetical protein